MCVEGGGEGQRHANMFKITVLCHSALTANGTVCSATRPCSRLASSRAFIKHTLYASWLNLLCMFQRYMQLMSLLVRPAHMQSLALPAAVILMALAIVSFTSSDVALALS